MEGREKNTREIWKKESKKKGKGRTTAGIRHPASHRVRVKASYTEEKEKAQRQKLAELILEKLVRNSQAKAGIYK